MANKKQIKELVQNYILENYSKISEEDIDNDGIEDTVDTDVTPDEEEDLSDADQALGSIIDLLNTTDQRVSAILRQTDSTAEKVAILDKMVDFILGGFNTRQDLPNSTLRDFFIKKFGGSEDIEEMSTTAGAPAPATKYAFKRKK